MGGGGGGGGDCTFKNCAVCGESKLVLITAKVPFCNVFVSVVQLSVVQLSQC